MVDDLKVALRFQAEGIPKTVGDVKKIQKSLADVQETNRKAAATAAILAEEYELSEQEVGQLTAALAQAEREAQQLEAKQIADDLEAAQRQAQALNQGLLAVGTTITAAITGAFATGLQTFAQFEQFEGILTNALGSPEAADEALESIEQFAATTPFQLDEAVQAFISLQNRGIEPTNEALRQLGDLAASQGKSLNQVTEAILDATTGEFERLKEFGIQASSAGDEVTLSFRGVETTVAKSQDAIAEAVLSLGDLEGVTGSMAAQSETLNGRLSNLQDEVTKASRAFGEFANNGARPVVDAAIGLVQSFNSLPAPIQRTIVASTALAGVLALAVTAITAYNLANGQRVVTEITASIETVKNTVATTANAAATTAATAAKAIYARVLGQATAAQVAQTNALAASATAAAAFAGAIASVVLVADTFRSVNAEASATRDSIQGVNDALDALDGTTAGEETARNFRELEETLNPVQRLLDDLIRGPLPGLATAAEASANRATVAFGELITATDDVKLAAAETANALEDGISVPSEDIEATVTAIDEATAALEAQRPVDEDAIARRDAQIESLSEYRDRITATTEGVVALGDATGGLTDKIKELDAGLKAGTENLANLQSEATAALEESFAADDVSTEERQTRLTAIEQNGLQDRLNLNDKQLRELKELRSQVEGTEQLQQVNAEIRDIEGNIARDRVALARSVADAKEAEEKRALKAAQDAAKERIEAAQKEADALKQAREDEERVATNRFSDQQRQAERRTQQEQQQRESAFADQQRRLDREFVESQQADTQAFEDAQRQREASFKDGQRSQEEAFEARIEGKREAFEQKQQAEAEAFQDRLNEKRDQGNREFDALDAEVERRIELSQAASADERKAIQERFEAEKRANEERRRIEQEVLADQQNVLAQADLDLSPLEQARADFEKALQEEQRAFEAQQQQEKAAFEEAEQAKIRAFEESQRVAAEQFDEQQRQRQLTFQEAQRQQELAFNEQQRTAEATFKAQERLLEQAFQDSQRAQERAFKDQQRQLDRQNAEEIASLLESARATAPEARRMGGPVEKGQPYLVGEEGPELIFPNRAGYVATARETARYLRGSDRGITGILSRKNESGRVEAKLDELIRTVRSRRPIALATINVGTNSVDDAMSAALSHQRAVIRSMRL